MGPIRHYHIMLTQDVCQIIVEASKQVFEQKRAVLNSFLLSGTGSLPNFPRSSGPEDAVEIP